MNIKRYIIPLLVLGFIGAIAIGWYLGSPLFIDQTVDEAFPFEAPSQEQIDQMSETEKMAMEEEFLSAVPDEETVAAMPEESKEQVETEVLAAAGKMPDHEMEESMPGDSAETALVLQGQFQDADSFHLGSGTAGVYQLPDASYVVRFEEFMVTNGPDLHVLLATGVSPTDQSDLGDYVDLGKLKGNKGNQNYELPAGVDPNAYKTIVIYCKPFHVVFSVATIGK